MWLTNRTEFSFRAVYGPIDTIISKNLENGNLFAGVCDIDNTFSHIPWGKCCKDHKIKPVYGVRLAVTENLERNNRRYPFNYMPLIALDNEGLKEIYQLVKRAHDQFYYRPRITYSQLNEISNHITILSGVAPDITRITRDFCIELSPNLPPALKEIRSIPAIACPDNWYPDSWEREIYEPLVDKQKREQKTTPQWILSFDQWEALFPGRGQALQNLLDLGNNCIADPVKAKMVKYTFPGKSLSEQCKENAAAKGIRIKGKGRYARRYKREMKLIIEKDYQDYFLVVSDLVRASKEKMLVGPGRGSSSGSLVCFLLGITTVDPLKYGLFFERFIDINRNDLPDIDIDFQDDKRQLAIKYLQQKYGKEKVAQLANISRLKPRSAIGKVAKALSVPIGDTVELKESLVERPSGDPRANYCILDTFKTTKIGKAFLKRYPEMWVSAKVENHASHSSVHAAGVIVCNEPITHFCGINSREAGKYIAMIDKKDAEQINLLKIDVLGLKTLSILADILKDIKKPLKWIYDIPLDDKKAYKIFKKRRYTGIFQFDGTIVQEVSNQIKIKSVNDIALIIAISRPGPMISGTTKAYIKEPGPHHIVYQEQVIKLLRDFAGMEWEDVTILRKAFSKSKGEKFFHGYKQKFLKGSIKKGHSEKESLKTWNKIQGSGSYLFNLSHAIAYGVISYWCAYLKAHYPLPFAVATLNHSNNDRQSVKILRDLKEIEGINYVAFNKNISVQKWSFKGKKLYGGLLTLNGIGIKSANLFVKLREQGAKIPPGIASKVKNFDSPFISIYPGKEIYGKVYKYPWRYGIEGQVSKISELNQDGSFHVIGCLIKKETSDINSLDNVSKRGGKFLDGPTTVLKLTIEDDTKELRCYIGPQEYKGLGKEIVETGSLNKDWYIFNGRFAQKWGIFYVTEGAKITE